MERREIRGTRLQIAKCYPNVYLSLTVVLYHSWS
jgi:hypothetical protein